MKLRIWHGCKVVGEMEFSDDDSALPGRMAFRGTEPRPEVVGFIGNADHVGIDPWLQATPTDMPVFSILAKDRLAVRAMWGYHEECTRAGLDQQAAEVEKAIEEMELWRHNNPDKVKLPDHKHKDRS